MGTATELLHRDHLNPLIQHLFGQEASVSSIDSVGQGFHATGYEVRLQGSDSDRVFARLISHLEFGHDLPSARIEAMLEASHSMPHALPTHAVVGITHDGTLVDLTHVHEVVAIAQFLPPGAINFCEILRAPTYSHEDAHQLAQSAQESALLMAQAMVDIHASQPFTGTPQEARSLYKRSLRAVIHNDELAAGVADLIDFDSATWVSHEDVVGLFADMERVRHAMGIHPERLRRIHGDFWANNIYFHIDQEGRRVPIVTDGRLVWGEPAIDAGWMIGEFVMQDLVRFGRFGHSFTGVAANALLHYVEKTGDVDLFNSLALPYSFQAFAEAFFTPGLTDDTRRKLVATAWGALKSRLDGEPFDLASMNTYTTHGLKLLAPHA
ncbi:MAG: phosphotransferase [Patescibacteria group bacterium]